jgi:hypothetical protein
MLSPPSQVYGAGRACHSPRAQASLLLLTALRIAQTQTKVTAFRFLHALQGYELVLTFSLSASPLCVTVSNVERDQVLALRKSDTKHREKVWFPFPALQAAICREMRTRLTSSQTGVLCQDADRLSLLSYDRMTQVYWRDGVCAVAGRVVEEDLTR